MRLWVLLFTLFSTTLMAKQPITLTLPSQLDDGHRFYHELLYEALTQAGHEVRIEIPREHIPQKRVLKMVESDQLSLTWMLSTPYRDERYLSIDVPLTNGLIGKRVLLIPPELQARFDDIDSIEDLRSSKLVAGLGMSWFDVEVWNTNQLNVYLEDGEWRSLYKKLSVDGEVNYFPRGINEVAAEALLNQHLVIEQRLMLVYERDFKFYLSPAMLPHMNELDAALKTAQQNGLIDRLVEKHWGESFEQLNPTQRVVIKLDLPSLGSQKN